MNRKEFKIFLKDCNTIEGLYIKLVEFKKITKQGLMNDNGLGIPFETISLDINSEKINCQYYMQGRRTYKNIKGFIRSVYPTIIDYNTYIDYNNKYINL